METHHKYRIGIIGGAGYTGGELIRLLLAHQHTEIQFVHSRSQAGKPLHEVHQDLLGDTELCFTDEVQEADVYFLCLPHGESKKWLSTHQLSPAAKVIDLGNDFRVNPIFGNMEFVYGLPEIHAAAIAQAQYIANPGCFATAIQLGLLPVVRAQHITEVYTVGITGATGAGQALSESTHFSWRNNNISAYKTLKHQHLGEIQRSLASQSSAGLAPEINFVPWRGDFTRGIFTTSILSTELSLEALQDLYRAFYRDAPFVRVSAQPIDLKQVVNTNKCLIHLEKEGNKLAIHSAIDNLLKGASGQAIQNMNIALGISQTHALLLKGSVF